MFPLARIESTTRAFESWFSIVTLNTDSRKQEKTPHNHSVLLLIPHSQFQSLIPTDLWHLPLCVRWGHVFIQRSRISYLISNSHVHAVHNKTSFFGSVCYFLWPRRSDVCVTNSFNLSRIQLISLVNLPCVMQSQLQYWWSVPVSLPIALTVKSGFVARLCRSQWRVFGHYCVFYFLLYVVSDSEQLYESVSWTQSLTKRILNGESRLKVRFSPGIGLVCVWEIYAMYFQFTVKFNQSVLVLLASWPTAEFLWELTWGPNHFNRDPYCFLWKWLDIKGSFWEVTYKDSWGKGLQRQLHWVSFPIF